jgi:hypothetical protein
VHKDAESAVQEVEPGNPILSGKKQYNKQSAFTRCPMKLARFPVVMRKERETGFIDGYS